MSHLISRQHILNLLRAEGYKFRRHAKRVELWGKPNDSHRVTIPQKGDVSELFASILLRQIGVDPEEAKRFLADAKVQPKKEKRKSV